MEVTRLHFTSYQMKEGAKYMSIYQLSKSISNNLLSKKYVSMYIKDPTQVKDVRVPENLQRAMAAEAEAARNARAKVVNLMMMMMMVMLMTMTLMTMMMAAEAEAARNARAEVDMSESGSPTSRVGREPD